MDSIAFVAGGLSIKSGTSLRSSGFVSGEATAAGPKRSSVSRCRLSMVIGIVFSTTTGNTADVAEQIKNKLGDKAAEPVEISDVGTAWDDYEAVLAGAPTWNTGADDQRSGTSWDDFLYGEINSVNLKGKPVAIFGCGDSVSYGDNFCDAIEEMHDQFAGAGAKMIGYVETAGYQHEESKAERDGKFLGLPLDEDNESDMTPDRIASWCDQILTEI